MEKMIEPGKELLTYILRHKPHWITCFETILGQWCLESGWGTAKNRQGVCLAAETNNFGGMKYRSWQASYGVVPFTYTDWNGKTDDYADLESIWHWPRLYFGLLAKKRYAKARKCNKDTRGYLATLVECKYVTEMPDKYGNPVTDPEKLKVMYPNKILDDIMQREMFYKLVKEVVEQ